MFRNFVLLSLMLFCASCTSASCTSTPSNAGKHCTNKSKIAKSAAKIYSPNIALSLGIVQTLSIIWNNPRSLKSKRLNPDSPDYERCRLYDVSRIANVTYCHYNDGVPKRTLRIEDPDRIIVATTLGSGTNITTRLNYKGLRFFEITSGPFAGYRIRIDSSDIDRCDGIRYSNSPPKHGTKENLLSLLHCDTAYVSYEIHED